MSTENPTPDSPTEVNPQAVVTQTTDDGGDEVKFDASKLVEGPGGVMITPEELRNWDSK
jgi:hypothetical protein